MSELEQKDKEIAALKKRMDIANREVARLDLKVRQLENEILAFKVLEQSWSVDKRNQQGIIQRTLDASNAKNQEIYREITDLKKENRELQAELELLKGE